MTDKKSPVPDFSSWKLVARKSIFFIPGKTEFAKKNPDEGDGENPFWCGHISEYKDSSGRAEGTEVDIFGYGSVLKFWGLSDEDYYNGYAIYRGKEWEFFAGKDYKGLVITRAMLKNGKSISVVACRAIIIIRDTGREIVSVTIPRDLLGLPPANK